MPRLTHKESVVVELLSRGREMYGLELVAASKGRLKRGTVYVTLGRMEDKGLVTSRLDPDASDTGGLPRRLYDATPLGLRLWRAWSDVARVLKLETAR
jgi:PadR family transcriptional regulator, regulatory protein PadR